MTPNAGLLHGAGAGPVTQREQVAAIAEALGEPVRLEEVDIDTYRAALTCRSCISAGQRDPDVRGIHSVFTVTASSASGSGVTPRPGPVGTAR